MEKKFEHESYASAVVSHVHGGDRNLCMSAVTHNNRIRLSIKHASLYRGLHETRLNPGKDIVTVEFSELEWGRLVSRLGKGEGTPCTIQSIGQKSVKDCPADETFSHLRLEVLDKAKSVAKHLTALQNFLEGFESELKFKKTVSKTELIKLVSQAQNLADQASMNITENIPFLTDQINNQITLLIEDVMSSVMGVLARRGDYERAKVTAETAMLNEAIDVETD